MNCIFCEGRDEDSLKERDRESLRLDSHSGPLLRVVGLSAGSHSARLLFGAYRLLLAREREETISYITSRGVALLK